MLKIYPVETKDEIEATKKLFREYADFLKADLAEFADLPWLIQYYEEFEEETANLPAGYEPPSGFILLASYKDELAGCVALGKLTNDACEMKRLFVREKYRKKGIGRALCKILIEQAVKAGYTQMRLATALQPPKALYNSLGFKKIAPYRDAPAEIKGIVFMELKLT
jgi:N-acetylglutamate synthase-like GNAT family acetyltransferase